MHSKTLVLVWVVVVSFGYTAAAHHGDPYSILGIKRGATSQDVRRAYKVLAKEWHPDKNDDPSAETKFIEINKAYELLSDPARRKMFDNHGLTEDTPNFRPPRPEAYAYSTFDPFEEFSSVFGKGFNFQFHMPDSGLFHKQTVTLKNFEKNVLPDSYRTPQLILTYSDWCMGCVRAAPMWKRLNEEMNPVGITMATVHAGREPDLARKLSARTDSLPHLVLVMDGRVYQYREEQLSVVNIIKFLRDKFGSQLVQRLDDSNYANFLDGWKDNRIRVLVTGQADVIRLRYLTLAFQYRQFAAFGYARLVEGQTTQLQDRYDIPSNMDSMYVFREDVDRPSAKLSMSDLPFSTMNDVVQANKYLALPRISSQAMLDALCPVESSRVRRRLCAILVTEEGSYHDNSRQALRDYGSRYYGPGKDRVRFAFVLNEKQASFVSALTHPELNQEVPTNPLRRVVVIWRHSSASVSFLWVPGIWKEEETDEDPEFPVASDDNIQTWNSSQHELTMTLRKLFLDSGSLPYEAALKELVDEHAAGLLTRIYSRLLVIAENIKDGIRKEDLLAAMSVIATIVFIVAVAYVMAYLVRLEEDSIQANRSKVASPSSNSCSSTASAATLQLKVHELRGETYNGMVRLLKPGCRTVILMVDKDTKTKLLPAFHRVAWPYRKNKTLMFGWMNIERGIEWYKQVLSLALPIGEGSPPNQLDSINPRNCVGTVLSLNGHRKYFCMYHAKHPEGQKMTYGQMPAKTNGLRRRLATSDSVNRRSSEAFLAFEDSTSESETTSDIEQGMSVSSPDDAEPLLDYEDSSFIYVERLLDGLPNWLDRLFEGTTHRYHVNYWPEFGNK